ncbi:MAG: nuclear transport factor 2 family protein [Gammaproteobacteria bacterium]|nr:nuclear transport factor 2 family protein [Gammaproteobacteria bacterium]
MSQADASSILREFLDAQAGRDFTRARACLSERGFIYSSPLSVFNDPDAFIDDISRLGCILEKLQIRRTFADGAEACVMMNIKVRMAELSSIDVAMWASVQGGRIVSMEAFFDGRKYDALFE